MICSLVTILPKFCKKSSRRMARPLDWFGVRAIADPGRKNGWVGLLSENQAESRIENNFTEVTARGTVNNGRGEQAVDQYQRPQNGDLRRGTVLVSIERNRQR